jgi:hypothetical protein
MHREISHDTPRVRRRQPVEPEALASVIKPRETYGIEAGSEICGHADLQNSHRGVEPIDKKESLTYSEAFLTLGPSWDRTRDLMLIKHAL